MKLLNTKILASILALAPLYASAATLHVKNDDNTNVEMLIEPGDGNLISTEHQIKHTLRPGEKKVVTVKSEDLGNASTFSIKGNVTLPSMHNKRGPLLIDKDYNVVFVGSKAGGVICVVEPVGAHS